MIIFQVLYVLNTIKINMLGECNLIYNFIFNIYNMQLFTDKNKEIEIFLIHFYNLVAKSSL